MSAGIDRPSTFAPSAVVSVYHGIMIHGRFVHSPTSIAGRLRRRAKAIANPVAICSPRNGEKLRNVPIANAAAVRRGASTPATSGCRQRLRQELTIHLEMLPGGDWPGKLLCDDPPALGAHRREP